MLFFTSLYIHRSLTTSLHLGIVFFTGKGLAHLFIPWQVLHELDHLKDKGKSSIQPLARRAINFLHDMFSAKHPRVRGQKISEATKDASNCADNNILQSSLQLKEQGFDVVSQN